MRLVIAEKPSVANAIAPVLQASTKKEGYIEGSAYLVSWCYGHLMQLQQPDEYCEEWAAKWSFEQLPMLPDKFRFKVAQAAKAQFATLKKLMNDSRVTEIVCATDADREGECIFRYVYNAVACRKPVLRLWVASLEAAAIKAAFKDIKSNSVYDDLFAAGYSRARADWLVGMNFSRLFSVRYNTFLTVGRVQTPTLAMIVKRDYQADHFEKEKFYTVDLDCGSFTASSARLDDENAAADIFRKTNGKSAVISDVTTEQKTTKPPKLYDLTTLQRDANKHFGLTAAQTLEGLQKLYEAQLTTYPRTDSQFITDDMQRSAEALIPTVFSVYSVYGACPSSYTLSRCVDNSKVTGHHAILPTQNISTADFSVLTDAQCKILRLICLRLICAAGEAHIYESVKVTVVCEDAEFTASGKTILSDGWKQYEKMALNEFSSGKKKTDESQTEKQLPNLVHGQRFDLVSSKITEHWTSPPPHYTEDTLLSAMEHAGSEDYSEEAEKKGLGTPATRASIIEGLVKHQLAQRKGKQILATDKGKSLIAVVPPKVKSPKLTAEWEMKLQQIEYGKYSANTFMQEIRQYVSDICAEYGNVDSSISFAPKSIGKCPNCGADIINGKYGFYCKGLCGMNVSSVYKKQLTEQQLTKLLSGQSVSYTSKGKKTTVLPKIEQFSYENKEGKTVSGYQWSSYYKAVGK